MRDRRGQTKEDGVEKMELSPPSRDVDVASLTPMPPRDHESSSLIIEAGSELEEITEEEEEEKQPSMGDALTVVVVADEQKQRAAAPPSLPAAEAPRALVPTEQTAINAESSFSGMDNPLQDDSAASRSKTSSNKEALKPSLPEPDDFRVPRVKKASGRRHDDDANGPLLGPPARQRSGGSVTAVSSIANATASENQQAPARKDPPKQLGKLIAPLEAPRAGTGFDASSGKLTPSGKGGSAAVASNTTEKDASSKLSKSAPGEAPPSAVRPGAQHVIPGRSSVRYADPPPAMHPAAGKAVAISSGVASAADSAALKTEKEKAKLRLALDVVSPGSRPRSQDRRQGAEQCDHDSKGGRQDAESVGSSISSTTHKGNLRRAEASSEDKDKPLNAPKRGQHPLPEVAAVGKDTIDSSDVVVADVVDQNFMEQQIRREADARIQNMVLAEATPLGDSPSENNSNKPFLCGLDLSKRQNKMFLLALLVIVGGIVIGVAVALTSSNNKSPEIIPNASMPQPTTPPPTMPPTIASTPAPTSESPTPSPIDIAPAPFDVNLTLELAFDNFPRDVGWSLAFANNTMINSVSRGTYTDELADSTIFEMIGSYYGSIVFTVTDEGSDGLCCQHGIGSYTLYRGSPQDGMVLATGAEYESSDATTFELLAPANDTFSFAAVYIATFDVFVEGGCEDVPVGVDIVCEVGATITIEENGGIQSASSCKQTLANTLRCSGMIGLVSVVFRCTAPNEVLLDARVVVPSAPVSCVGGGVVRSIARLEPQCNLNGAIVSTLACSNPTDTVTAIGSNKCVSNTSCSTNCSTSVDGFAAVSSFLPQSSNASCIEVFDGRTLPPSESELQTVDYIVIFGVYVEGGCQDTPISVDITCTSENAVIEFLETSTTYPSSCTPGEMNNSLLCSGPQNISSAGAVSFSCSTPLDSVPGVVVSVPPTSATCTSEGTIFSGVNIYTACVEGFVSTGLLSCSPSALFFMLDTGVDLCASYTTCASACDRSLNDFLAFVDQPPPICIEGGPPPVIPGGVHLTLEIIFDDYPSETGWLLSFLNGTIIDGSRVGSYSLEERVSVPIVSYPTMVNFTMIDSFGDGICCRFEMGLYTLYLGDPANNNILASGGEYLFSDTTILDLGSF